jgi:hypothetical protein
MPKSDFFQRLFCCAAPNGKTKENDLEAEVLALKAKLMAAEEEKKQMAEELYDEKAKQSILAQKIVKVEAEYEDFRRTAVEPLSAWRPLSRTVSARRPFTPLVLPEDMPLDMKKADAFTLQRTETASTAVSASAPLGNAVGRLSSC